MIDLDGTDNKSQLGANAMLSFSLSSAKLAAMVSKKPFYGYLYELSHGAKKRSTYLMPIPSCNIINGGKHAGGRLKIQEFMLLPVGAKTYSEGLQMVVEVLSQFKECNQEETWNCRHQRRR